MLARWRSGLLLLAMLYLIGWGRLRGRTGARSSLEPWCFAAGWCVLVLSILPWVDAAALERFSAHMAQHELMMLIAAPLLMAGRPLAVCLWALPGRWRHRAAAPLDRSRGFRPAEGALPRRAPFREAAAAVGVPAVDPHPRKLESVE